MKKHLISFSIIILLILGACSNNDHKQNEIHGQTAGFETIEISEVTDYMEDNFIVLDVRETNEYAEGHIPDSVNLPLSEIQTGNYTLDNSEKYVVICRSGNRSKTASDILIKDGYNIVNVAEGMSTWSGEIAK